jgi:hypothetical protein
MIVWIGLLLALGWLFVAVVRRMSWLIGVTREFERFQGAVESLDLRLGSAADPVMIRVDEIRRRSGTPETLATDLDPCLAVLEELASESRALRPPAALAGHAAVLTHEAERAVRAVELIRHGLDVMLAARGGRELEAETSLKRGGLNLRHARDTFRETAAEVAALRPVDVVQRRGGAPATIATIATTRSAAGDDLLETPFEPRM